MSSTSGTTRSINYLTVASYGSDPERFASLWGAAHHLIGKDILKFHCVWWPAMCMAAGIDPPREIFVHGYLLMGGQKLGKTMIQSGVTGQGEGARTLKITEVSPLALADEFGVDPLRYHLLREVPLGGDGDFSYEGIVSRYNADLANNLGNLVSRVATVVHSKCGGVGPAPDPDSPLGTTAAEVLAATTDAWARWAPHEALEATWRLIGATNAELEAAEPWKMEPGPAVDAVLGNALEVLRIVAILVAPAMPATATEIWRRIGVEGEPASVRLPAAAAWGAYPGRRSRGEGRSPLPAAQGMSGWFDSHCHVQEEYLRGGAKGDSEADLSVVLERAGAAGVDRLVCIGTDAATSAQAIAVARGVRGEGHRTARVGLHRIAPARGDNRCGRSGCTARARVRRR